MGNCNRKIQNREIRNRENRNSTSNFEPISSGINSSAINNSKINNLGIELKEMVYKLDNIIGEGSFGSVYTCKNNKHVCVKVIQKLKNKIVSPQGKLLNYNVKNVHKEICILSSLDHDNIIKYISHYENVENIYIVLEYAKGMDFITYVLNKSKKICEYEAMQYLKILTEILEYIHSKNIIHGDLKFENIVIHPKTRELKLIDFGSSFVFIKGLNDLNYINSDVKKIGTLGYKAPELFITNAFFNKNIDVYSLGCIAFALIEKKLPFTDEYYYKINNLKNIQSFNNKIIRVSEKYNSFIRNTLAEPSKRLQSNLLVYHPLFNNNDLTMMMKYLNKFIYNRFKYDINNKENYIAREKNRIYRMYFL